MSRLSCVAVVVLVVWVQGCAHACVGFIAVFAYRAYITCSPSAGKHSMLPLQMVCLQTAWSCICLQMKKFALETYRSSQPVPFYKAPNSIVGRLLSVVYR